MWTVDPDQRINPGVDFEYHSSNKDEGLLFGINGF